MCRYISISIYIYIYINIYLVARGFGASQQQKLAELGLTLRHSNLERRAASLWRESKRKRVNILRVE